MEIQDRMSPDYLFPYLPVPESLKAFAQPATFYSFLAGVLTYLILAKAELHPRAAGEFDTQSARIFI
jgi:hypothetical protein